VVQISAHSILHHFNPGPWREATRALSPAQLEKLPHRAQPEAADGGFLLDGDEPLLAELARDGRASNAAIAAAIHWHESTVRRRIDELRRSGVVYFEVDVDNRVQGLNTHALLWLSVEPARLEEAGRALATHPEIPFAAATTGPANLVASAVFRDTQHLYEYLTGELAGLPGVTSVETAPIIRTLKRTGLVH
jgi:DNA-binding Lrp family transcriptional regulator